MTEMILTLLVGGSQESLGDFFFLMLYFYAIDHSHGLKNGKYKGVLKYLLPAFGFSHLFVPLSL